MKRLSIIVPMYNVEAYVERCLRTLEDQDLPKEDYEIICINDGSPDNSREVVLRFQKEFNNIILIDQENQGVSRARNNGMDRACGKYLLFIDPDDYIDKNRIASILNIADKEKAIVVFLGFTIEDEDGSLLKKVFYEDDSQKIYHGKIAYFEARGDGKTDPDRIWGVLFNLEFINKNNLRYLPDVPYLEDGELIARILCLADRCVFDGNSFYRRTTRSGSATHSNLFNSEFAVKGFIKAAVNLRNFRDTDAISQDQKEFMNQPVVKFVILSIAATSKLYTFEMFLKVNSILKENDFKKLRLSGCDKSYKRMGTLYNLSAFLLYFYMIIRPAGLKIRNMLSKALGK